eukprot:CAMPEP_0174260194 /NCGR_PEP_ID=MMETSP0439-20130205/9198_1 /TAXON_ID=0 /ORGANISM="Stereomyxa ramosa, Strain Chinc5" /LENGTH=189 /DNA_ID=CAMNT_0015344387 /DNA_START=103 /DNA_END=672 /DNA_ORIENTATION=+
MKQQNYQPLDAPAQDYALDDLEEQRSEVPRYNDNKIPLEWTAWPQDIDEEIGMTPNQEKMRVATLGRMINESYYDPDQYSSPFFCVMTMNNKIYEVVYSITFLLFAATIGLVMSLVMAVVTALFEFVHIYVARPVVKLVKIILDLLRVPMYMAANLLHPFCAMIFPGSFKNIRGPFFVQHSYSGRDRVV